MINIEKITNIYPLWKPSDVAFIKRIEWSVGNVILVVYCQAKNKGLGWPNMSDDFVEIAISFNNVSNFNLNFINNGLQQISGFNILDVSNDGLEKINFQIEDYENGIISFNCEKVEIMGMSTPFRL